MRLNQTTGNWIAPPTMTRWNARLFLGNMFNASNTAMLKEAGITAVANLTNDDFRRDLASLDTPYPFEYLLLNQLDGNNVQPETITRFLDWMDTRWAEGHSILIHCHAGISRTSSFFIAWLMHCSGCDMNSDLRGEWSRWEDEIGLRRPIIDPHYKLKQSILTYFASRMPIERSLDAACLPEDGDFERSTE